MSLESDISYVYENVYQKAQYDDKTKRYIIKQEDYVPLNLTNRQLNILRKMCKHSKIKLEYHDYRLPSVENEELFKEYQEIKKQQDSNPNSPNIATLEQRRIEIRNKIVTDNLALVRAIVDRNFEGIQDNPNKEEIYQLGYEVLFTLVDNHTIVIPRKFTVYLSAHLVTDIKNQLYKLGNEMHFKTKNLLELNKLREKVLAKNPLTTVKDLSQTQGFDEENIEELLNINDLLNFISIDEEIEKLNSNHNNQNSPLYNDGFETEIIQQAVREYIQKILYTLPPQQKDVIMLSYGFKDGRYYNDAQIAIILGVTASRISIARQNAIKNLKASIRANYLKEFYTPLQSHKSIPSTTSCLQELEEILLSQIPKEDILYYISDLSEVNQTIFLTYYGFADGQRHSLRSIADMLNIAPNIAVYCKNKSNKHIRKKITEEIRAYYNYNVSYETYLNYLIEAYIISSKIRKR